MHTHVAFGALPDDALATSEFVDNVDGLFDCLNAVCLKSANQYNRALTPSSSHWKHLDICVDIFSHLTVTNSKCAVPCINGFILTINPAKHLFECLNTEHGFKFLLTNRLNCTVWRIILRMFVAGVGLETTQIHLSSATLSTMFL